MDGPPELACARCFVEEVLRTGFMLIDVLGTLLDDLTAARLAGMRDGAVGE